MLFSDAFLHNPENTPTREKWIQYLLNNNRIGAARAVKGSMLRNGVFDQLSKIRLASLIISGDRDKLAGPNDSIRIHDKLFNSKIVSLPNAGHLTPVENPDAVNSAISKFIANLD